MNNMKLGILVGGFLLMAGSFVHAGNWKGDLKAGAGYWAGDATYSIGGNAWTPEDGNVRLPDKVSELTFPLNVVFASLGGSLCWKDRLELHGDVMANLTDPSAKVKDSDWGVFEDDGQLDVYSESDAQLSAVAADVGARYWFRRLASTNRFSWSIGAGPGVMVQRLDWTISNLDQSYPRYPSEGHDYESGEVGTYQAQIVMPYVDVSAVFKVKRLGARIGLGIGPALVSDEDDHILRKKRSTADMVGVGVKASGEVRYDFTRHLFGLARVEALSVQASGTQEQKGYGGDLVGFRGEVDEEFSSTSVNAGLALGYAF